jgi:transmembrane 9 superfamily protein 2/4
MAMAKRSAAAAADEHEKYMELKRDYKLDEVGHTIEAAAMRNHLLRRKKKKRLFFRKNKPVSLAEVLFPGVTPEEYQRDEDLFIITELVTSKKTQLPFEFYDLPGCPKPSFAHFKRSRKRHSRKNLGTRLQGLDLIPAPYDIHLLQNVYCATVCPTVQLETHQIRWLRKLIDRQYKVHLALDQLPVLMRNTRENYVVRGFPIGFKAPPQYTGSDQVEYYLYNHLKFRIVLATTESGGYHITGFDVHPVSIDHTEESCLAVAERRIQEEQEQQDQDEEEDEEQDQDEEEEQQDEEEEEEEEEETADSKGKYVIENDPRTFLKLRAKGGATLPVTYTYEVEFEVSKLTWADRWDVYMIGTPDDDIHFFAIINSFMIVLFLTGAIATIMIRTLRKDISAYNEMAMLEDGSEETGWKLVHGDVFRPPSHPMILSVVVGTGAQIGTAFFITMVSAILRFVNPIKKGQTLTAIIVLYVLAGIVAGYVSARIYKFTENKHWKRCTMLTATALPGFLVTVFVILNIFLGIAGAATAVSFGLILVVFALWVCVSTPLVFIGALIGYRAPKFETPVKTNQIARFIPEQPWYSQPPISFLLGGILPFGSVCIELFFIMSALWLQQIYYVMGFLSAVLLILAATCAQVSIVMDYLQLCAEDHRWWWKSFANCASAGVYLFAYSLWFLVSRLDLVGFLPVVIYLTYMFMISLCFGLFCGSVGFLCSLWFNKTIYGALKVD